MNVNIPDDATVTVELHHPTTNIPALFALSKIEDLDKHGTPVRLLQESYNKTINQLDYTLLQIKKLALQAHDIRAEALEYLHSLRVLDRDKELEKRKSSS